MKSIRKCAAVAATVMLGAAGALVSAPPAGAAAGPPQGAEGPSVKGGCEPMGLPWLCGGLTNWSEKTAKYTIDLRKRDGNCTIWNWDGGPTKNEENATCGKPTELPTDMKVGGPGSGVDVDAFTFDTRYWVTFYGGNLSFPVEGGTWTKIKTNEQADCQDDNGSIVCNVVG